MYTWVLTYHSLVTDDWRAFANSWLYWMLCACCTTVAAATAAVDRGVVVVVVRCRYIGCLALFFHNKHARSRTHSGLILLFSVKTNDQTNERTNEQTNKWTNINQPTDLLYIHTVVCECMCCMLVCACMSVSYFMVVRYICPTKDDKGKADTYTLSQSHCTLSMSFNSLFGLPLITAVQTYTHTHIQIGNL